MHLRNYPRYYIKNGKRRAVYYTAEVRDLKALGWTEEGKDAPALGLVAAPVAEPEARHAAEPEVKPEHETERQETDEAVDLTGLTRAELLQYALDRGVDLPNNASKTQLLEACEKL